MVSTSYHSHPRYRLAHSDSCTSTHARNRRSPYRSHSGCTDTRGTGARPAIEGSAHNVGSWVRRPGVPRSAGRRPRLHRRLAGEAFPEFQSGHIRREGEHEHRPALHIHGDIAIRDLQGGLHRASRPLGISSHRAVGSRGRVTETTRRMAVRLQCGTERLHLGGNDV